MAVVQYTPVEEANLRRQAGNMIEIVVAAEFVFSDDCKHRPGLGWMHERQRMEIGAGARIRQHANSRRTVFMLPRALNKAGLGLPFLWHGLHRVALIWL